ncbi:MAG: hypothetical protein ACYCYE_01160 [Clostridia bacterium]
MKNTKKVMALIIVCCIAMSLLSGCTNAAEGKALYDAMVKSQSIKSSHNDMQLTLRLDATGLSEQEQQSFAQMKAMLNGAKMSMNMKQSTNADNTAVKAQAGVNMYMAGMSMDMGVWVDMDLNGAFPRFKEIIKLPAIIAASDPSMAGKEYMVMDLGQLINTPGINTQTQSVDYANTMKLTKKLLEKSLAFMGKYLAQYDPGFKFITDAGTKDIITPERTVKTHVYQVKLDDKAAKKLIRYTVNNFANNKEAMDFAVEYIKFVGKFSVPAPGVQSPTAELDKMMADFEKEKPALLAEFNKSMDQLEGIQIFGEKGITLEYAVDENGYIVSQSGSIDFIIDVAKLSSIESLKDSEYTGAGIYNVGFDFSMLTYNINKDLAIEMPVVTPENSINYNDMIKATTPVQTIQ